jgi:LacI family transcriptional regulator
VKTENCQRSRGKSRKRVLVLLGWYDHRVHRSIEAYAQRKRWQVNTHFTRERLVPWGWKGDGILAWLGAGDDLVEFVMGSGIPTVDFSFRRSQLKLPRVLENNARIGDLAAEYYLNRGFTHFAFYSNAENWAYHERGQEFVSVIARAGHTCAWLRQPASATGAEQQQDQWRRNREWLSLQLAEMPKPLAVLAANDDQAIEVMEACELRGIRVPAEVAVMGVGNNLLAPESREIPISSVDTNLGALGQLGAELLDKIMRGEAAPHSPLRVLPLGVVERQSSNIFALSHPGLRAGLQFIQSHAHEWIGVADIAAAARMSRRALHKAFVEKLGSRPGEVLRTTRIEHGKRLLASSNHRVEVVAKMCGYQSASSFNSAFQRLTSITPTQFREASSR